MRYFHKAIAAIWPATVTATLLGLSFARPAHAVPVIIESEGLPGIDVAQRDSEGTLRLFEAEDDNADGIISLVADLDPEALSLLVHIKTGPVASNWVYIHFTPIVAPNGSLIEPIPFFITGTEERVITQWNSLPATPFTLGQPLSVAGGQIPGLDAVVYRSLGFRLAADIVDLDLTTLPLYTGSAQVGGLVRFQVVPEPSTLGLALAGVVIIAVVRRSRIRV